MLIPIPRSTHPITRLTIETPVGVFGGSFGPGCHEYTFTLPEGVHENQVTVVAEFSPDDVTIDKRIPQVVVCEARPVVEPMPEPVIEPVAEPVIEPVAEPMIEPVAEPEVSYPVRRKLKKS